MFRTCQLLGKNWKESVRLDMGNDSEWFLLHIIKCLARFSDEPEKNHPHVGPTCQLAKEGDTKNFWIRLGRR